MGLDAMEIQLSLKGTNGLVSLKLWFLIKETELGGPWVSEQYKIGTLFFAIT